MVSFGAVAWGLIYEVLRAWKWNGDCGLGRGVGEGLVRRGVCKWFN